MTKTTAKSFINQFVAFVKGDDAEVQAAKTLRGAESALKSIIASLEGDTIGLEDKLQDAKDNASNRLINNGQTISDKHSYVVNLINAENDIKMAEENLEAHLQKITFLKSKLEEISK
jgi:hypothetical protein